MLRKGAKRLAFSGSLAASFAPMMMLVEVYVSRTALDDVGGRLCISSCSLQSYQNLEFNDG